MSAPATPTGAPTQWVGTPRARRRAGLSIYSILLIMLLSVSVLSSIVVGIIGYVNGTEALRAIAYEKLVEIRENRAARSRSCSRRSRTRCGSSAMNETSKQAARAFADGFAELEQQPSSIPRHPPPLDGLLSRHVRGRPVRGDGRGGRRRRRSPRRRRRAELPAVPLRDPVRRLGGGDPHRRRRRRQRVVGGAREVPRLLPRDDAAAGLRGRPDARHAGQRRLHARSRASTSARTCFDGPVPALEPRRRPTARRWTATSSATW